MSIEEIPIDKQHRLPYGSFLHARNQRSILLEDIEGQPENFEAEVFHHPNVEKQNDGKTMETPSNLPNNSMAIGEI